jgi:hypothetical protein
MNQIELYYLRKKAEKRVVENRIKELSKDLLNKELKGQPSED